MNLQTNCKTQITTTTTVYSSKPNLCLSPTRKKGPSFLQVTLSLSLSFYLFMYKACSFFVSGSVSLFTDLLFCLLVFSIVSPILCWVIETHKTQLLDSTQQGQMQMHEPNKLRDEKLSDGNNLTTHPAQDLDLEMQQQQQQQQEEDDHVSTVTSVPCCVVVVANDNPLPLPSSLPVPDSPTKPSLSRVSSSHDHCRVCQQDKEEVLIDLGCKCKGGLAKSHRSCIDAWFMTRGSNRCEICQEIAVNVSPPESQPSTNYWVWRLDPTYRPRDRQRCPEQGCSSPLWVAFAILIGGLLLDVLISITLGLSALPVNIIIGVIVVIGLGTALRLALEFCHDWSSRRGVQRVDANVNIVYHPTL
ncbi:hypothetical protein LINPERPRIM_LOCUS24221 [Linum perenne]